MSKDAMKVMFGSLSDEELENKHSFCQVAEMYNTVFGGYPAVRVTKRECITKIRTAIM